jgi:hypothetical protein
VVRRWRWVFWAAVVVQFVVLYAPAAVGGGVEFPFADKAVHLLIYATTVWAGRKAGFSLGVLVAVFAAHSVLSEIVQDTIIPDRAGDVRDVLADLAGVALGALVPIARVRGHDRVAPEDQAP